ncbi:acylphosphatase [Sulfurivirga caldicuralii]|uniref:Acylphosphatase n=1 Tax=Sulfurivirga caldicuralii TaxID=364032 RepID=A0A1N6EZG0_9GAMM|nr:acylphosphatase [Sulfurivirga caldicuralii]SIN88381.1 acylphosphatase [Sulfurivirga caldicuralii]
MERLHALVSGRVQGVWFRAYTQRKARELGLTGWVRNLPDGRVEVVAEGPRPQLEALAQWLWQGSPLSKVTDVSLSWLPATGEFLRFEVVG